MNRKKKKQLTGEKFDELNKYLQTEFDDDIYNELTSEAYYNLDDEYALYFFELFYSQINFIQENKHKPLSVMKDLKKKVPDEWELQFLCEKITDYFEEANTKDKKIKIICRKMKEITDDYQDKIYRQMNEQKEAEKDAVRNRILASVKDLPDNKARLKSLKLQLIEHERNQDQLSKLADEIDDTSHYSQLIKEIQRLSALDELETDTKETEETNTDKKLKTTLTARQWSIATRFFINHYNLRDIEVTAFARLLAVLNGGKNLQNLRVDLGNERGLITAKTRKDAKEVADLCRHCDLPKIADEIERVIDQIKPYNL